MQLDTKKAEQKARLCESGYLGKPETCDCIHSTEFGLVVYRTH